MTQIVDLVDEVYEAIEWQRQPQQMDEADVRARLHNQVVDSIRFLYVMTGRSAMFGDQLFEKDNEVPVALVVDLDAAERMVVTMYAQVLFLRKVQASVSAIVGYTTDALSVTNADKPYQYIKQSIDVLMGEVRRVFYKMVQYNTL